ncbi:MAG: nicotinamide-nucleotide amidase [Arenicella sp.]|jgi:nicotinamide-nucleotide amidase
METTYAEIITIGDEILYGQITDTNSQWLGSELNKIGVKVIRKSAIADKPEDILSTFAEAETRADIIIVTGGLGPTKDDITKHTFCEYFGVEMTHRPEVMENIEALFKVRQRSLNKMNQTQALVPSNADVLMNKVGTAPGMWFEKGNKTFISMPGVPHEMKKMISEQAIPRLQKKYETPFILHKMVKTIGVAEAVLAETLEDWETNLPENIKLAFLPRLGQVRLRLTAMGNSLEEITQEVEQEVNKLPDLIGKYIYAYDDEEVEHTIGKLLMARNQTLATAESCTGGLIANKITDIAGCSAYFVGGIVAYGYEVKVSQLGVKQETLDEHGAVSEQVAMEMAENVRKKYGSSYGLATTGIAGPDGGTPEKPVGTVWIGYSDENFTFAKHYQLTPNRMMNVNFTYNLAMNLLRRQILGEGVNKEDV